MAVNITQYKMGCEPVTDNIQGMSHVTIITAAAVHHDNWFLLLVLFQVEWKGTLEWNYFSCPLVQGSDIVPLNITSTHTE